MKSKLLINKITFIGISVALLLILALTPSSPNSFSDQLNAGRSHTLKSIKQKQVELEPLPVDWNQPVKIVATCNKPGFPISIQGDDEYILIVNNLECRPQNTQMVHLSAELNSPNQIPSDCYFQNTIAIPQTLNTDRRLTFPNTPFKQRIQKPTLLDQKLDQTEKERTFFLFVTEGDLSDKNKYTRVTGRLIQQSPRVSIYLDDQQQTQELATGLIDEIIEIMEHRVLDQISQKCGPIRDVDQSGRFTILLSPWLNKLQGGKISINGFVRPSDFRESVSEPFSNHCDMLYLNSTLKPGQELLDLLSHEVTHAAISSIRTAHHDFQSGPLMDEEDWLNEGIAHIMEPGFTNRDYRISEFYRSPESYSLVVSDYYRTRLWRNHGCRGAVNLFLDWCNQIDPTQNFTVRFAQHPLTGIKKIERLTEQRFSELFRQWSLYLVSQSLKFRNLDNSKSDETSFLCGNFMVAGPALRTWNPLRDQNLSLKIASTASSFIHLKSNSQQPHDIIINVNGFQKMQLTLLKIPRNQNQMILTATNNFSASNESQFEDQIEVRLSCQHPKHSRVERISLEFCGAGLSRAERKPRTYVVSELNTKFSEQPGILKFVSSGTQQKDEILTSHFLVRMPRNRLPQKNKTSYLNFKAVVQTKEQTRIARQCESQFPIKATPRLADATVKTKVK